MPKLLRQSAEGRAEFFENQADLLHQLATEGQRPHALFVGCADSRVVPEQLFGAKPGDLFMLRNIANIIPPYEFGDIATTAVLAYAVNHLQVPHLIICGHTDCGGIKGLDADVPEPQLTQWVDLARPAQQAVDTARDLEPDARHNAIVEQNVVLQLDHVKTYPFIKNALQAGRLELHGWVFHLDGPQVTAYDPETRHFIPIQ